MSKAISCYAFETLYAKLNHTTPHTLSEYIKILNEDSTHLSSSAPLFITWNQSGRLRGCIGTFQAQPIEQGVARYSIVSAFQDSRFSPISKKELGPSLSVSVTLLENFTDIDAWDDWTVGAHGLRVSFEIDRNHYSGTFLPSVAEEEGWDKVTTLYYLIRKSDYFSVRNDEAKVRSFYAKGLKEGWLTLTRYDGTKNSLDYEEFLKIRDQL